MKSLGLLQHRRQDKNSIFFSTHSSIPMMMAILAILTPYSNIFLMDVCFSKKARFVIGYWQKYENHGRNNFVRVNGKTFSNIEKILLFLLLLLKLLYYLELQSLVQQSRKLNYRYLNFN